MRHFLKSSILFRLGFAVALLLTVGSAMAE